MSDDPLSSLADSVANAIMGLTGDDKRAYDDLNFYSDYVMGFRNPEYVEPSPLIRAIYDELQHTDDDLLILAPRGSAKSTAVTITYVSWALGRNPLLRFLLAFAVKEKQGEAFLRQLKQIIMFNERYIQVFGNLKPPQPEKWDETEIIVRRPTPPGGLKDSSVYICGLGTAVPSKRADIIICDDIVNEENAYSDIQRAHVVRFVYKTLFPILVPGGRKLMVGTTWDPRDLYAYTADAWRLTIPDPDPELDLEKLMEHYEEADEEERVITFA